jgi:16S rRNA (uracil1498-N3)-methyltransferase
MTTENRDLVESGGKVRLFVNHPLHERARFAPSPAQCHYLLRVMRAATGSVLRVFNGSDGEWRARIVEAGRNNCVLECEVRGAAQMGTPDFWLAFAPIKKTPADYLAQKATELGVRVLQPVITHRTIARRVNTDRMRANAIEAAEQSGRLDVPEVREPVDLDALFVGWPRERALLFCDEGGDAPTMADALSQSDAIHKAWGVLTGPEGGFDEGERALIRAHASVMPVTLGPRIMRADTAAISALAILAALKGDWRA